MNVLIQPTGSGVVTPGPDAAQARAVVGGGGRGCVGRVGGGLVSRSRWPTVARTPYSSDGCPPAQDAEREGDGHGGEGEQDTGLQELAGPVVGGRQVLAGEADDVVLGEAGPVVVAARV